MLTRAFGREERAFFMGLKEWREVEKVRDCGLGQIAQRLAPLVDLKARGLGDASLIAAVSAGYMGAARIDDVREPLLQGLIGGGMTSTEAGALVRKVFDESVGKKGVLYDWCDLAYTLIMEALLGPADEIEDEQPGEPVAVEKAVPRSRTAKRASSKSTKPSE